MELSRCLLDSLSQEGLSVKLTGKLARPSAPQLTAFLHQFRLIVVFREVTEEWLSSGDTVSEARPLHSCHTHFR